MHEGVTTVVTLHEESPEADVVNMGILHDGVNVTVCVDVSITVALQVVACQKVSYYLQYLKHATFLLYKCMCTHILLANECCYLFPAAVSHMHEFNSSISTKYY